MRELPVPNGKCWCGCGEDTKPKRFCFSSHARTAESKLIHMEYGSIAALLADHGYSPFAKNLHEEYERFTKAGA